MQEAQSEQFKCPKCGAVNPPIYVETGTEYVYFDMEKGGYVIKSREIQIIKPPLIFCGDCDSELRRDQVPDLDFAED
jgi:hypothetical protein